MLKKIVLILLISLNISSYANDNKEDIDIKKLSKTIGHIIENSDDLDLKQLLRVIKKNVNKNSFLMNENLEDLNKIQTMINEKVSTKDLKRADDFLIKNAEDKDIFEIEKAKLHHKILKSLNHKS